MNIVDYVILGIVGLCVLFGFYRGFIQTVLNLGGCLLSFIGSFLLFPHLADAVSGNTEITRMVSSFTDSGSLLGDLDLSSQAVSNLSQSSIVGIVERANLPEPISTLLKHNLDQQVFSPLGQLATSVGDYVNQTLISVSINVICFLICFVVCFVVLSILINMLRAVFRFPVLKQLDWLAGGAFGFLLGAALCFAVFTLMPLVESVIPFPEFRAMIDQSVLSKFFEQGNLIISIMNRRL